MERSLFAIAVALMSVVGATAQTTVNPPRNPDQVSQECLLGTDALEWTALGLTSAQVDQVLAIQTECKTDCAATPESATKDGTMSKAALEKHQARIRKILTVDQYNKWLVWCSERDGHTQLK